MQIKPKSICVIGVDSSHVYAFTSLINKTNYYQVNTVVDDSLSDKTISVSRRAKVRAQVASLEKVSIVTEIPKADAYLVLAVDADHHESILKTIKQFNKPIFLDKPISYTLDEGVKILSDYDFFSASALRFCDFVLEAKKKMNSHSSILIESSIDFVDEIPPFSWYGIHLIEMLSVLFPNIENIDSIKVSDKEIVLKGTYGTQSYCIVAHLAKDCPFQIHVQNHNDFMTFKQDPDTVLYDNLVDEILKYIDTSVTPISKGTMRNTLNLVEQVNEQIENYKKI